MSLTVAVIVLAVLCVLLLAALGFVMSRPKDLETHSTSRWRLQRLRARRGHRPGGSA